RRPANVESWRESKDPCSVAACLRRSIGAVQPNVAWPHQATLGRPATFVAATLEKAVGDELRRYSGLWLSPTFVAATLQRLAKARVVALGDAGRM
ncbi:MAG: hypothetical protein AB1778_10055, partial [Candidatus Bipolaricaulota bacterium]